MKVRSTIDKLLGRYGTWEWLVVFLIVFASFALRWYRIDDALVGYHAANEGFYTDMGARYLEGGAFSPFTDPLDRNNPPYYLFLVRIVFGIVGVSLSLARAVSVIASVATVIVVYLLGRDLYGRTAGLVAALVYGLSPGSVLVGGNAQVDGLLVLQCASAVLAFERAEQTKSRFAAALGGVFLGLGVLTKLTALIVIPALAYWETRVWRGFGWIKQRHVKVFAGVLAVMAAPWYITRLLIDPAWRAGQTYLLGTIEPPSWETVGVWLGSEMFWLVSPIVFVVFLFAVGVLLVRRHQADILVLAMLAANVVFYLFYSFHTYYLMPAVPFVAVAVGAFVEFLGVKGVKRSVPVLLVLAIILSVSAGVIVGGKKWGGWYSSDIRDIVVREGYHPEDVVLVVDEDILGSWEPAIRDAFPDTEIVAWTGELPDDQRPVLYLHWYSADHAQAGDESVPHRRHGPVFFGYTVTLPPSAAVHHFGVVDARLLKVGPWYRFGFVDTQAPSELVVEVLRP